MNTGTIGYALVGLQCYLDQNMYFWDKFDPKISRKCHNSIKNGPEKRLKLFKPNMNRFGNIHSLFSLSYGL